MRFFEVVTATAMLLGGAKCAAVIDSQAMSAIDPTDVQVHAAHRTRTVWHTTLHTPTSTAAPLSTAESAPLSFPGTSLPPPDTPCKKICSCTEGEQPAEGRMYCGFCWGVNSEGGMLYGTDVVKCSPGDCCNYEYLDGRCDVNDQTDAKNVREQYCPGGMLLKNMRDAEIGVVGKKEGMAKRQHIINDSEDDIAVDANTSKTLGTDHKPQACNPNCSCPKGAFPPEGQIYCGWCALVRSTSGTPLLVEDRIVCKNEGCCNYGNEDATCRGNGDFWPNPKYCQPPQGA